MLSHKKFEIFIFFLFFATVTKAQSPSFYKEYIPYRFSISVDSLLTIILDSVNNEALQGLTIDRFSNHCTWEWLKEDIVLRYYPDFKTDTLGCLTYLTCYSNRFYLSLNNKYKIPMTFGLLDVMFKYNYHKRQSKDFKQSGIIIAIIQSNRMKKIHSFFSKIPKEALNLKYRDSY